MPVLIKLIILAVILIGVLVVNFMAFSFIVRWIIESSLWRRSFRKGE